MWLTHFVIRGGKQQHFILLQNLFSTKIQREEVSVMLISGMGPYYVTLLCCISKMTVNSGNHFPVLNFLNFIIVAPTCRFKTCYICTLFLIRPNVSVTSRRSLIKLQSIHNPSSVFTLWHHAITVLSPRCIDCLIRVSCVQSQTFLVFFLTGGFLSVFLSSLWDVFAPV